MVSRIKILNNEVVHEPDSNDCAYSNERDLTCTFAGEFLASDVLSWALAGSECDYLPTKKSSYLFMSAVGRGIWWFNAEGSDHRF